jgi:glycosyltransferase involved in cell wall biosynthesis
MPEPTALPQSYFVICNRDRDYYQVALALSETGRLARYVTDYYSGSWPVAVPGLSHRANQGIAAELAQTSPAAVLTQGIQSVGARITRRAPSSYRLVDKQVAASAARAVRRYEAGGGRANVLSYGGYALPAFAAADGVKALFQYHPCAAMNEQLLTEDAQSWSSHKFAPERIAGDQRRLKELERAEASASQVVPYGFFDVDPKISSVSAAGKPPTVLFVGQGVQRKGLHHLLRAWEHLGRQASLTLVLSQCDPTIGHMIPDGVTVLSGLSRPHLNELMERTDVLALPSLIEGYGLVINEAIARGCFVVASNNTGLASLSAPTTVGLTHEAGDPQDLAAALSRAIDYVANNPDHRDASHQFAKSWLWADYRARVRSLLP